MYCRFFNTGMELLSSVWEHPLFANTPTPSFANAEGARSR